MTRGQDLPRPNALAAHVIGVLAPALWGAADAVDNQDSP